MVLNEARRKPGSWLCMDPVGVQMNLGYSCLLSQVRQQVLCQLLASGVDHLDNNGGSATMTTMTPGTVGVRCRSLQR
ncbi:uncharacterized protein BO66DRAFT_164014 [Aspergillus aculeatinus CBS 121060]|uniref:Uncharacterized protein n=1 Tax=Aspergillus aculeatinus CBS 121060 TaxID=1448322 RepID=A0ACD1GZK3_9EURO|nr:hypothetical protein BO66DRAFT_164014 [Aspergillus aculeatinus CBS 121060]RAH66916.1 hypothetical protein BO66DRAFT_164014 [Aspergillus aculeatinus CBS 121060]